VVVPPLGYSEVDASTGGEWVEVQNTGVITAAARVDRPVERLHPSATPFAFVLVKLDGADTALAHIVKDDLDRVAVGARVEVVWAADEARVGSIRASPASGDRRRATGEAAAKALRSRSPRHSSRGCGRKAGKTKKMTATGKGCSQPTRTKEGVKAKTRARQGQAEAHGREENGRCAPRPSNLTRKAEVIAKKAVKSPKAKPTSGRVAAKGLHPQVTQMTHSRSLIHFITLTSALSRGERETRE
jgi:hypothetical protein